MRIFVLGGTGFIGSAFCARAARDGHDLAVLTRDPSSATARLGTTVRPIAADDDAALDGALAGSDAVVNFAGASIAEGRWTAKRKAQLRESRIGLTDRLVAAIERVPSRPRVLVSGSAVGYYGDTGDTLVDEGSPAGDDFLAHIARDWEGAARGAEEYGLRVVTPRLGMVLGEGGGALAKLQPIFALGLGGRLGSGRQWVSWVHLADVVDALLLAIADERWTGPVNLVAPHPVTNAELTRTLAAALHRPAVLPAPGFALRIALGELAETLLGGQRVDGKRLRELGVQPRFATLERALEDIYGGRRDAA